MIMEVVSEIVCWVILICLVKIVFVGTSNVGFKEKMVNERLSDTTTALKEAIAILVLEKAFKI